MLAGVLPRLYPQMLERAYSHQDAGLPVYILTAASQEMADLLARVLAFDGGLGSRSEIVDGHYTGRPAGPFNYREGKVLSMRELAERERHRPGGLLRLLGLRVRPAHAAGRGQRRRRQPRRPAAADRRCDEGWEIVDAGPSGQRLKLLAALGAGTAAASAGRAVLDRRG